MRVRMDPIRFGAWALLAASCASPQPDTIYAATLGSELALEGIEQTAPSEWSFVAGDIDDGLGHPVPGAGPAIVVKSAATYSPPYRSPHSFALLEGVTTDGDFEFELEMMQTGRETAHRDLCVVFGYEGPDRFFYAHLGAVPDEYSCNVFQVDRADRVRIGVIPEDGVSWGRGVWHACRLVCDGGRARLFMGDAEEPLFDVALDRAPTGRVGFGTFDDAGAFRNVRLFDEPEPRERAPD